MSSQLASATPAVRTRRSARALAVSSLGPLTSLAGVIWAVLQPYRITLLDPAGQGFWWLAVQPPLLVVAVGVVFHLVVAQGLVRDLDSDPEP